MIRIVRDASGLIYIQGHDDPIAGGLQATLDGTTISIANTQGGRPLVVDDYSQLVDANGAGFASPTAALAYLAMVFAAPPQHPAVEAVAAIDVPAGMPLAVSRATGQIVTARADTYPLAFVAGLAAEPAAAGFPAQASRGPVMLADWTVVVGAPALQPGRPYFLAPAGGLAATAVNAAAVCIARVGLAVSPTTLLVDPSDPILL